MDFEIEDDPEEPSYDFEWNNNSKPSKGGQKSYFEADNQEEDEYAYDFAVDNKKKKSAPLSAFSPIPTSQKSNNNKTAVVNNVSALEKAQSMLNKYSNKTFNEPASNFRQSATKTFTEDDISIGSEDEFRCSTIVFNSYFHC